MECDVTSFELPDALLVRPCRIVSPRAEMNQAERSATPCKRRHETLEVVGTFRPTVETQNSAFLRLQLCWTRHQRASKGCHAMTDTGRSGFTPIAAGVSSRIRSSPLAA